MESGIDVEVRAIWQSVKGKNELLSRSADPKTDL